MKKTYIILVIGMLMMTACGEKHVAKNTIKEFLKASVVVNSDGEQDYSVKSFGDIDSTRYVTPDAVNKMHAIADKDKNFQSTLLYWKPNENEQLKYLTVEMEVENRDTVYTFYLTNDLLKVVAFK